MDISKARQNELMNAFRSKQNESDQIAALLRCAASMLFIDLQEKNTLYYPRVYWFDQQRVIDLLSQYAKDVEANKQLLE